MEHVSEGAGQTPMLPSSAAIRRALARTLVAAAAELSAGLLAAQALRRELAGPAAPLPVFGELPAFTLTDQAGRSFGSADLGGQVWVFVFFSAPCLGHCLAMNQRLAQVRVAAPGVVRCVSITTDPQADRPAVLALYAAQLGVERESLTWRFLTGPQKAIRRLAWSGFSFAAAYFIGSGDALPVELLHGTRLTLVDGRNRVRGYYASTDDAQHRSLLADIHRLRTETSDSNPYR